MKEYLLDHMTWQELHDARDKFDAVFIPVGATEQHGPHLEVRFDAFSASELCYRAAQTLNEQGHWVLVAPTVSYGVSWYHRNVIGTITLSHQTFGNMIKDICRSLTRHGFKNLIIVNTHGGNNSTLTSCLDELNAEDQIRVIMAHWAALAAPEIKRLGIETPSMHAGESETSLGYGLGMNVRRDKLSRTILNRKEKHRELGFPVSRHITYDPTMPGSRVSIPMDFIEQITDAGVIGDASLATEEKGQCIVSYINATLTEMVTELIASGR